MNQIHEKKCTVDLDNTEFTTQTIAPARRSKNNNIIGKKRN